MKKTSQASFPSADCCSAPSQRLLYGDPMRVAGALAVIVYHVAGYGQEHSDQMAAAERWACTLAYSATLWCVPIFILLSGALLLDPRRSEPAGAFYRRRIARIGIPFVFWCAFYLAYRKYALGGSLSPAAAVQALVAGTPFYHLHFLYVLIGLYVFTPVFRVVTRASQSAADCRLLLPALAVGALLVATADEAAIEVIGGGGKSSAFAKFLPFVGYYLAGSWLRERRLSRRGLAVALAVAGLAALLTALTVAIPEAWVGRHLRFLRGWLSPTVILLSLCAFLVLATWFAGSPQSSSVRASERGSVGRSESLREPERESVKAGNHDSDPSRSHSPTLSPSDSPALPRSHSPTLSPSNAPTLSLRRLAERIAPATLGIYLIHPVFLHLARETKNLDWSWDLTGLWPVSWVGIPLVSLLVFAASLAATLLIQQVPYLRRVVG